MSHSLRHTILALITLLVIGGGWYLWQERSHLAVSPPSGEGVTPPAQDPLVAAQSANSAGLAPAAAAAAGSAASAPFPNTYTNKTYGFSFKYPSTLKIGEETPQGTQVTTILAQDTAQHIGFQIYITPFTDTDTNITAARVARDLPSVTIRDAQIAQIGASSPGLAFVTRDPSFGESRQVWVVYKKHLYQISSYSSQDALLQKVLTTWVFTK